MRSLLAVSAGLVCMLLGLRASMRLQQSSNRLHRWTEILAHLELLLIPGAPPLPQLLRQCADDVHLPDMLIKAMADAMERDPLVALADAYQAQPYEGTEKAALLRLFRGLGHGPLEQRRLAAAQSREEIALLADAASARASRDARLFRTLGVTGGCCLTLMLI